MDDTTSGAFVVVSFDGIGKGLQAFQFEALCDCCRAERADAEGTTEATKLVLEIISF